MKKELVVLGISVAIGVVAVLLKHQSSVDLNETEDLKELHSFNDLFHIH